MIHIETQTILDLKIRSRLSPKYRVRENPNRSKHVVHMSVGIKL